MVVKLCAFGGNLSQSIIIGINHVMEMILTKVPTPWQFHEEKTDSSPHLSILKTQVFLENENMYANIGNFSKPLSYISAEN